MSDVTHILSQIESGDPSAAEQLLPLAYDELRNLAAAKMAQEAPGQALAIMDHPNIAKVLEAGATESGRPYFVMELVRGIPITDFCDQNSLTTRERLDTSRARLMGPSTRPRRT